MSGDRNLIVAGMERDWPEGRGIFHNKDKTFLVWVNEEDQLRIISMQQGSDVKEVFDRLSRGIKAVEDSIYNASNKKFMFDSRYGYIHSCPTNLGTGMRASVHVTLPGWHKRGIQALKQRCEELKVQPRGTRGESGGHIDDTYDISNKHRLGYTEVELVQNMIDAVNTLLAEDNLPAPFPVFKSNCLSKKYLTKDIWKRLSGHVTRTANFTIAKAIACAVEFDDQTLGFYTGDHDTYKDFSVLLDPIIQDYHGIRPGSTHSSDMDSNKISGRIERESIVKSTRIRVGRNLKGFGLSPAISEDHRKEVESLMKRVASKLSGDLAGTYYPLEGMNESTRRKLVDDHFLFMSGDRNLIEAGMERDWPQGRGIFLNNKKTFLVWVNEEDHLRTISMQQGADVKAVFDRLCRGIAAVEGCMKDAGQQFMYDEKYGYIHTCPSNLGTGMRASVHVTLPGWHKKGIQALKQRCEELKVQPRGTRGESGGHIDDTYDISNKHRLGYTEVELVQNMI